MSKHEFLAFDLGATSGRSIKGTLLDGKITMEEQTRFPNNMITINNHLHWNIFGLFENLIKGLKYFKQNSDNGPEAVGVDTWGVDFGFLAADGSVLETPYAYRDSRTNGMMEEFFKLMPRSKVYSHTGIQFMQLNSLYQLYAMKMANSSVLNSATDLLFIPDLLNYLLTGIKTSEFTFATTSQMFNPITMSWEKEIFDAMLVPISIMRKPIMPGNIIGNILPELSKGIGFNKIPVVAVASHDTGSAVAAVPAENENFAYLSSGTWSLMGIETQKPLINETTEKLNFTNEGGVEGTFRVLKNITGLWLLEQCKKDWELAENYTFEEMEKIAMETKPFQFFVDPDAADFMNPDNMSAAIRFYCKRTSQQIPTSDSQIIRCIFDSLTLKYKYVFEQLKEIAPFAISKLHVIGGGSKNALLCQLTANSTGVTVLAGPSEATALGNLMVQAMAMGYIKSLAEIRQVVKNSVNPVVYQPTETDKWAEAYNTFKKVISKN